MKKLVLAVLVSGAAFTAYADSKHDTKKHEAAFKNLDKDNDGAVSMSEAGVKSDDAKQTAAYNAADTNTDGKLQPEEFEKFEKGQHKK